MAKQIKRIIFYILSILMLNGSLAYAQDKALKSEKSWAHFDMSMSYSGSGYTKSQRAVVDTGEVIYTSDSTQNGLMLTCLRGRLFAAVSLEPLDFHEVFSKTSTHRKWRYVDMRLDDGKKVGLGMWIYKPELKAISSAKKSQAAKLYNAVIRRQKIRLYMTSKKPVVLNLPKPNRVFAEFGAKCGMGKFAKEKK